MSNTFQYLASYHRKDMTSTPKWKKVKLEDLSQHLTNDMLRIWLHIFMLLPKDL